MRVTIRLQCVRVLLEACAHAIEVSCTHALVAYCYSQISRSSLVFSYWCVLEWTRDEFTPTLSFEIQPRLVLNYFCSLRNCECGQ